ncbi:hypothetical protein HanIR_Chr14g0704071 [Helianthus annuus]|nr:hypothetical protein HanIR_Chr14g0704071 [Helianthus annuus]
MDTVRRFSKKKKKKKKKVLCLIPHVGSVLFNHNGKHENIPITAYSAVENPVREDDMKFDIFVKGIRLWRWRSNVMLCLWGMSNCVTV